MIDAWGVPNNFWLTDTSIYISICVIFLEFVKSEFPRFKFCFNKLYITCKLLFHLLLLYILYSGA